MDTTDTYSEQNLPILECSTLDMSYAVGDQSSNTLLEAIHWVKGSDDQRLLSSGIPHSGPNLSEYQDDW